MVKKAGSQANSSDPNRNKSLAIRTILKKMPTATTVQVVEAVKKEYGHSVSHNMIYMIKTKSNMASDGRPRKVKGTRSSTPMNSTTTWIEAISAARQLLKASGSIENAVALLRALND